jgi:hypothetical protein
MSTPTKIFGASLEEDGFVKEWAPMKRLTINNEIRDTIRNVLRCIETQAF